MNAKKHLQALSVLALTAFVSQTIAAAYACDPRNQVHSELAVSSNGLGKIVLAVLESELATLPPEIEADFPRQSTLKTAIGTLKLDKIHFGSLVPGDPRVQCAKLECTVTIPLTNVKLITDVTLDPSVMKSKSSPLIDPVKGVTLHIGDLGKASQTQTSLVVKARLTGDVEHPVKILSAGTHLGTNDVQLSAPEHQANESASGGAMIINGFGRIVHADDSSSGIAHEFARQLDSAIVPLLESSINTALKNIPLFDSDMNIRNLALPTLPASPVTNSQIALAGSNQSDAAQKCANGAQTAKTIEALMTACKTVNNINAEVPHFLDYAKSSANPQAIDLLEEIAAAWQSAVEKYRSLSAVPPTQPGPKMIRVKGKLVPETYSGPHARPASLNDSDRKELSQIEGLVTQLNAAADQMSAKLSQQLLNVQLRISAMQMDQANQSMDLLLGACVTCFQNPDPQVPSSWAETLRNNTPPTYDFGAGMSWNDINTAIAGIPLDFCLDATYKMTQCPSNDSMLGTNEIHVKFRKPPRVGYGSKGFYVDLSDLEIKDSRIQAGKNLEGRVISDVMPTEAEGRILAYATPTLSPDKSQVMFGNLKVNDHIRVKGQGFIIDRVENALLSLFSGLFTGILVKKYQSQAIAPLPAGIQIQGLHYDSQGMQTFVTLKNLNAFLQPASSTPN